MATDNPNLGGQPLFVSAPDNLLQKLASSKLSKDPKEWEQEIMDYLHEQHPYIADHKVVVAMNKTDTDDGHGVGHVKIGDKVTMPVIVESNRLQPLDLFVADDRLQPLTKEAFTAAVQSHSFGKAVKPGKGEASDSSITYATLPPFDGKYAYGSLGFTRDQLTEVLEPLHEANQMGFCLANPWFGEVLGEYIKHAQLEQEEEKVAGVAYSARMVTTRPFETIKTAGFAQVSTDKGNVPALVFDHHLTFGRGEVATPGRFSVLGLDKEATYGRAWRGYPAGRPVQEFDIPEREIGDRAVLALIKEGSAVASEPFTVLDQDDKRTLVEADDGRRWSLRFDADNPLYKQAEDQIFLSDEWAMFPVGREADLLNVDVANQKTLPVGMTSIEKVGGLFKVHQAGRLESLKRVPAEGMALDKLASYLTGLDDEVRGAILDHMDKVGRAFFVIYPEVEKTAGETYSFPEPDPSVFESCTLAAGLITPDLCKRAKVEEEKAKKTIDAILGLNFLNEENMHKFVDRIDALEEAKDCVAQLLLASRLGLSIDSQPLRTAMFSLDSVSRDLRELRNAVTAK